MQNVPDIAIHIAAARVERILASPTAVPHPDYPGKWLAVWFDGHTTHRVGPQPSQEDATRYARDWAAWEANKWQARAPLSSAWSAPEPEALDPDELDGEFDHELAQRRELVAHLSCCDEGLTASEVADIMDDR